jgi:hypothetical protein
LRLRPGAPEGDRERRKTDEPFHRRFSVAKVPYFGFGSNPQIFHGSFSDRVLKGSIMPLPCGNDQLFALKLPRQYDPAACFMRLSLITRTAVFVGEMKPQLERRPEILR